MLPGSASSAARPGTADPSLASPRDTRDVAEFAFPRRPFPDRDDGVIGLDAHHGIDGRAPPQDLRGLERRMHAAHHHAAAGMQLLYDRRDTHRG